MTTERRYQIGLVLLFLAGLALGTIEFPCPAFFSSNAALSKLCSHTLVDIYHKIGEAFMIAAVLAAVVDEALKEKLIRQADRYISGYELPPELRDHLHNYLDSPLVRTTWDVTYIIEKWTDKEGKICDGYVKLTTISDYEMTNYSRRTAQYKFLFDIEDSLHDNIGQTKITSIVLPGKPPLQGADLEKEVYGQNGYQRFPKSPMTFQLRSPHRGGTPPYQFRAESIECFRDSGYSPFWAAYPVMQVTLTVLYAKADFKVSIELTYSDNDAATREELTDQEGTKWTIEGPILPGQGFLARWDAIKLPAYI